MSNLKQVIKDIVIKSFEEDKQELNTFAVNSSDKDTAKRALNLFARALDNMLDEEKQNLITIGKRLERELDDLYKDFLPRVVFDESQQVIIRTFDHFKAIVADYEQLKNMALQELEKMAN